MKLGGYRRIGTAVVTVVVILAAVLFVVMRRRAATVQAAAPSAGMASRVSVTTATAK
jgi:hypothetical protein